MIYFTFIYCKYTATFYYKYSNYYIYIYLYKGDSLKYFNFFIHFKFILFFY